MQDWLHRTAESSIGREQETYNLELDVNAAELWSIPSDFRAQL